MVGIRNFTPRLYQETILASCVKANCLVILPTGLGKTKTAIMVAAQRLSSYPNSKVLFLTVTKPLAEQIAEEIKASLEITPEEVALLTGAIPPEKRYALWDQAQVIVATPQSIENDLMNSKAPLENVSLLVIDEAHNAVGEYAFTWIAKQYSKKSRFPRIMGLTASPGSDLERIQEVCKNLNIEEIEIRTTKDPDVKQYVHEIDIKWVQVNLPEMFKDISKHFRSFIKERLEKLKEWGLLQRASVDFVNKTDLLQLQSQLRGLVSTGETDQNTWTGISALAEIMKVHHALELLETQGIIPLYSYMERLNKDAETSSVKAVKNIAKDLHYRSAFIMTRKLFEEKVEHPKLVELQNIISSELKDSNRKIIIFSQFRDSAQDIVEKMNALHNTKPRIFVGQVKKNETGMSQKEQKQVLQNFRDGVFNVLVATSIAEQGLDIPEVDTVIFYEPIPSAIRHIQRRGRTGRHGGGKVIVLMAKETLDEGYRWSAHHKERKMYQHLEMLKGKIAFTQEKKEEKQHILSSEQKIKIFADHREKSSGILKELIDMHIDLKLESLEVADYVLSSNVGVELKKVEDFVQSIIDGRLLEQIKNLSQSYSKPLLIIEGIEDIYAIRNVHANAIRGMLAAIAIGYRVPLLYTKTPKDSALLLHTIARREQETDKEFAPHAQKKPMSIKEQQEYIVSSLPGVGGALARPLLKHFGSVKNVVNADQKELEKVDLIGKKKAEKIRDILDRDYQTLE